MHGVIEGIVIGSVVWLAFAALAIRSLHRRIIQLEARLPDTDG